MVPRPVAADAADENAVLEPTGPKSGVLNTPVGTVGLAVLKVLVDTQKDDPIAAVSPLVPLSVAPEDVTFVALLVVVLVAADAICAKLATPAVPAKSDNVARAETIRSFVLLIILKSINL